MTAAHFDPGSPVSTAFRSAIGDRITAHLDGHVDELATIGAELDPLLATMRQLVGGGKRLRPAYVVWGAVAAGGWPADPTPLLDAAASLDLLHASALVHDDVMDSSDLRRGMPAAHRQFEALHTDHHWRGAADGFGRAGAILLGDLLLMWSVEMLHTAGLPTAALARALPYVAAMRTEVTCGQFLDVVSQAQDPASQDVADALDEANRVVQFKSASYTVQRPVQFGAVLGGADEALVEALAVYGSAVGRAFQFRDDLLDLFGEPDRTGKTIGDDLREGKRTVLIAHAWSRTTDAGRETLGQLFGRGDLGPGEIDTLRTLITDSGAVSEVETMINSLHDEAVTAVSGTTMTEEGRTALLALAEASVRRTF